MVMMEDDCHAKILVLTFYDKHIGDYDQSMIEHDRSFPNIRL